MPVCDDQQVTTFAAPEPGAPEPGTASSQTALPSSHPLVDGRTTKSPLVLAARAQHVPFTPVWFMRQAGRSLPEYREARKGRQMLESCFTTDLVVELTLQPVRRHKVDGAIIFSDIVVPIKAVGIDVTIEPGIGPVVAEPFRTRADVDRLRDLDPADVAPVIAAVTELTRELGSTPLIGFVGAPFTIASYLVEGGPSRDHARTKALMLSDPDTWHALLTRIASICSTFLRLQIEAGVSVVQLFDSWAGALPAIWYREFAMPHSAQVLAAVADTGVPRIHFGVGTGELLGSMRDAGCEVVGVDFRIPLDEASRRIGAATPLQGNLDPAVLFADWPVIDRAVRDVVDSAQNLPGHIFNLGHGVLPTTDPDVLTRVTALVHELTA